MGYVYNYEANVQIVYTVVEGIIHIPFGTEVAIAAFAEGARHQCIKYLFDVRDTQFKDSITNIAKFAFDLEKTGIKTEYYVAIVANNSKMEHQLFHAISKNRGYSRLRYFSDYNSAHNWIRNI